MSVKALEEYLKTKEAQGIKFNKIVPFWGDEAPMLNADERAAIILNVMQQVDDGRATISEDAPFNDNHPKTNLKELLEKL